MLWQTITPRQPHYAARNVPVTLIHGVHGVNGLAKVEVLLIVFLTEARKDHTSSVCRLNLKSNELRAQNLLHSTM
jgi:hypothetical protein